MKTRFLPSEILRIAPLNRHFVACRPKAAVNSPHSRRFAKSEALRQSRQRLDCGGFGTAFAQRFMNDRGECRRALYSAANPRNQK
jgi:hypothetical protein